jgi:hypothetical protein
VLFNAVLMHAHCIYVQHCSKADHTPLRCDNNIVYVSDSRAQGAVTLTRAFRRNGHSITRMWAPEWVCLIFNMWRRLTAFKTALKKGLQPPDYGYTVSTSTYT